jgi:hypothetical protein
MAGLTTIKARADSHITRAIANVLNPGNEFIAARTDDAIPPEGKQPTIDLQRSYAVEALWGARNILRNIDIPLVLEKRKRHIPVHDEFDVELRRTTQRLTTETYSAKNCIRNANKETTSVDRSRRLGVAEKAVIAAQRQIRLMQSPFKRLLASGAFVTSIVIVLSGVIYYLGFGIHSSPSASSPSTPTTSLAETTAKNI